MMLGGTLFTFGIFFKPILSDFGWTRALTSGAFSVLMIVYGLLCIVVGRITDRFGPRIVVTTCGVLIGIGYLLMSQTSAVWQLYLFYGVIIGAGISGSYIPQVSTVAKWFVKRRGLMTGVAMSGISAGAIVMPPVADWLLSNYGWRTSYVVLGLIFFAVNVLAAQFLQRDSSQKLKLLNDQNEVLGESVNLNVKGFTLKEAMLTRQFWLLCVAYFSYGLFLGAVMVHVVPHATELGIPSTVAAYIIAISGGLSIVGRLTIGGASDRIGIRSALLISFTLATAALFWLLLAKQTWMFFLFAAVLGLGWGGIATTISPSVAELFGLSSHGVIFGVFALSNFIGGALGPFFAGGVFDIAGSYDWAFLASTLVSILGLVSAVLLRLTKKPKLP
jgi:MFS family permease